MSVKGKFFNFSWFQHSLPHPLHWHTVVNALCGFKLFSLIVNALWLLGFGLLTGCALLGPFLKMHVNVHVHVSCWLKVLRHEFLINLLLHEYVSAIPLWCFYILAFAFYQSNVWFSQLFFFFLVIFTCHDLKDIRDCFPF